MGYKLFLMLLLCGNIVYSRDTVTGHYTEHRNTYSGICFRGEVGWNRSWFASAGVSYLFSQYSEHGSVSFVPYGAVEVNYGNYATKQPVFMGYKAGVEFGGSLAILVAEFRLYSGGLGEEFVFTPKIGLSAVGSVNLCYGYNIFDKASNLYNIGHHQFSLSVNLGVITFKRENKLIAF